MLKGGWGLFYDTLNAADFNPNQTGYDVTTTSTVSTDFGQTWNFGDPKNGISPLTNPFPVRSDGSRFDTPIGSSLGVDTLLGQNYTANNLNREHGRVQRWRVSLQRELARNMAVEVAYNGSFADRLSISIAQSYVPEIYYNSSNVRDNAQQVFLQTNVTNPFRITNFASLQATDPALYQRMAGNAFFTAATVQRQALLRDFPQMSGLTYADLPLGKIKTHQLEIMLNRRFSQGLSANAAFSATRATLNRTVEAYDREPTLWQTSNSARPFRLTAGWVYELPFGPGKPFFADPGIARQHTRRVAGERHVRVPARCLAGLGQYLFLRRPRRHRDRQPADCAPARRHDRPDEAMVQHRRRVRAGSRQAAGGLPEAGLPLPRRRRARIQLYPAQLELCATVRSRAAAARCSSAWTCRTR